MHIEENKYSFCNNLLAAKVIYKNKKYYKIFSCTLINEVAFSDLNCRAANVCSIDE